MTFDIAGKYQLSISTLQLIMPLGFTHILRLAQRVYTVAVYATSCLITCLPKHSWNP